MSFQPTDREIHEFYRRGRPLRCPCCEKELAVAVLDSVTTEDRRALCRAIDAGDAVLVSIEDCEHDARVARDEGRLLGWIE